MRPPPPGRLRHSDRGSQYAALACRDRPAAAGPGWTRRGNPCDDATAESLVKTLKVEGVRPTDFETSSLSRRSSRASSRSRTAGLPPALGRRSPARFEEENAQPPVKTAILTSVPTKGANAFACPRLIEMDRQRTDVLSGRPPRKACPAPGAWRPCTSTGPRGSRGDRPGYAKGRDREVRLPEPY